MPRTQGFERALLRLHQAHTLRQLGHAVVEVIHELMPMQAAAAFLRPMGFAESLIFARPEHLPMFKMWVREAPAVDIWLKRCPPSPGQRLIRHTDHTPDRVFARSAMCRRMAEYNLRYGAAIQVWNRNELLAIVIADRSKAQGDFSDADMQLLGRIYPFLSTAIRRVFTHHIALQHRKSLVHAASSVNGGIALLDSDLKALEFNTKAIEICARWSGENPRRWKASHSLAIPPEILNACRELDSISRNTRSRKTRMELIHPTDAALKCEIQRVTVGGPPLDSGDFVLRFSIEPRATRVDTMPVSVSSQGVLSPREQELAELIAKGKTNHQAALELSKSPSTIRNQLHSVFSKLGIQNRSELASRWAQRA